MNADKAKMVRLSVAVILFIIVMVAPLIYLKTLTGQSSNPAERALWVYGQSLQGNSTYDGEAYQVYPSLTEHKEGDHKTWTRANGNECWLLDPQESYTPKQTAPEKCKES